jgi:Ca2+-binding RTX toxin-like protein
MADIAFDGSQEDYAEFMAPLMADIEDPLLRQIATEFASLTAREGTVASEGLVGDASDNVLIGGKGNDGVDGKDGSDIYIYRSGDGHEWLNDTGPATDTDTLIFTDLDPSDITLNRNGDDLLIIVIATGAIIEVNDFFKQWGTAGNGIEQIRFADDTVWDRDDIKANTVFTGSPGNNVITDSAQDDVIHGLGGNDYIKIGAGSDTILYGMGDGSDTIEGTSNSLTDHDKLVLTNLAPDDVELSRVGNALVIKVKETGETVVDLYFFSGSSSLANWNNNAWGIERQRADRRQGQRRRRRQGRPPATVLPAPASTTR